MNQIIFVAAATGYTGRAVVDALARHPDRQSMRIVAHVRPDSPQLDFWKNRFARLSIEVDTTAWREEDFRKTFSRLKPSLIFSLLGTTRSRIGREKGASYETVDLGLTLMLLRAAQAGGSHPKFVYLSSAGVTPKSRGAYFQARARAEDVIQKSGLPYLIARPSFITGPDRDDGRLMERYGAAAIDLTLSMAGFLGASRLRERYQSTTNTILAQALVEKALNMKENLILESEDLRGLS